jgi:branched-chain amino acid transport system ATP-binding protein
MSLSVRNLALRYDQASVLNGVDLDVAPGEIVGLVGPNGAGKTSLLRAISGCVRWEMEAFRGSVRGKIHLDGSVDFDDQDIAPLLPHQIAARGLVLVPERGRPFREMTILENLEVGAHLLRDRAKVAKRLEYVFDLFPVLYERRHQVSGIISGGERTMLAIGRALMTETRLLLIDEPSVGLSPRIKDRLFEAIREIHLGGVTILLSEQDFLFAFELASRSYVLSQGQILGHGTREELLSSDRIRKLYLGR